MRPFIELDEPGTPITYRRDGILELPRGGGTPSKMILLDHPLEMPRAKVRDVAERWEWLAIFIRIADRKVRKKQPLGRYETAKIPGATNNGGRASKGGKSWDIESESTSVTPSIG